MTGQAEIWQSAFRQYGADLLSANPDQWITASIHRLSAGKLFDAACGTGRHLDALLSVGSHVTAIDASESALALVANFPSDPRIALDQSTLETWSPEAGSYSGGICVDALSAVDDPRIAIESLRLATRTGGVLLATVNGVSDQMFSTARIEGDGIIRNKVGGFEFRGFSATAITQLFESRGWIVRELTERSYVEEAHAHRPYRHAHRAVCLRVEAR